MADAVWFITLPDEPEEAVCRDCELPQCSPECEAARSDAARWDDIEARLASALSRAQRAEQAEAVAAALLEKMTGLLSDSQRWPELEGLLRESRKWLAKRSDVGF